MLTDGPEPDRIRLGRPYLKIAAVVALAAGILGLGYLGPHPAAQVTALPSSSPSPTRSPTNLAAIKETPSPAPVASPSARINDPALLQDLTGMPLVAHVSGESITWLPLQLTSQSPGVIGNRLYYVVGGDRIESSTLGSTADPLTLVGVPHCQAIVQLAAAGGNLAYVVVSPGQPPASLGGCDGFGPASWSLHIMDLRTLKSRQLATGPWPTVVVGAAPPPVNVALTPTAVAFDRRDANPSSGSETIEVHAIDGRTLWTTRTEAPVTKLMLGGDRLAVVTHDQPPATTNTLWLADTSDPNLREVAHPASSASLSADGDYLTWDLSVRNGLSPASVVPDIGIQNIATGNVTFLGPLVTTDLHYPTAPVVTTTQHGPVVAWFATSPSGMVYPAFRSLAGGRSGFLESIQQPVWMAMAGNSLVWMTEGADGWSVVAFAADLSSL
jgi:hypothetical protein